MKHSEEISELKKTVEELSSPRRFNPGDEIYFFGEGQPHRGNVCKFYYNRDHDCWAYEASDERGVFWTLDTEDGLMSAGNLKELYGLIREG